MDNGLVLQNALDADGQFHCGAVLKVVFAPETHLLLHLAAVVHYFDLVTKGQHEPVKNNNLSDLDYPRSERAPITNDSPCEETRTKRIQRGEPNAPSSSSVPHGRRLRSSWVDPFRRRLPPGQKPSLMKILEAAHYGISLKGPDYPEVQYTFVRPHARGGDGNLPKYVYQQNYPAVQIFETLLDSIGL
jgi:hypothetical protein